MPRDQCNSDDLSFLTKILISAVGKKWKQAKVYVSFGFSDVMGSGDICQCYGTKGNQGRTYYAYSVISSYYCSSGLFPRGQARSIHRSSCGLEDMAS